MTAFFMLAIGLASIVGNPTSGMIMQYLDAAAGLRGWQWLFLLEGIPSVLLGCMVFFLLTDRPQEADWLSAEQRNWLVARMLAEDIQRQERHQADRLSAILQWRVWLLVAIYFTVAVGSNAGGAPVQKVPFRGSLSWKQVIQAPATLLPWPWERPVSMRAACHCPGG